MENILQSIVKIIIIGGFYESVLVRGNRQFLPPLPYYQNEDYIAPGFALPYQDPIPIYYQDDNVPPPISYQNLNSYSPPQLFHQNENYNPIHAANPGGIYPTPHILPYKPGFYPPYKPPQRVNLGVSQVTHKKSPRPELHERPAETSPKKPAFYATNIIVKDERQTPYYHDEYNKNYHEEDYNDNYSDDISSPPEPCLTSPYRYFEPARVNPNTPKVPDKYNLCNPYFQPNFGSGVYTVKMPITLLPSRFPPRVEELIERIQNYFSTYTHQETPKPQNQTSPVTTVQPVTEAASESEPHSTVAMEVQHKKNTTVEIEELNLEQTNPEANEKTTVAAINELEHSTPKTIVVEIEKVETNEEMAPDAQAKKESQMAVQSTQNPSETTENTPTTEYITQREELRVNEHDHTMTPSAFPAVNSNTPGENQIMGSIPTGSPEHQPKDLESLTTTTESAAGGNNLEGTKTSQPITHVTDNKG